MDIASVEPVFTSEEIAELQKSKARREIPKRTVVRLIDECSFRCCLCWNVDADVGVVIHHIRPHATEPDDSYENLVILCTDHHVKVHTSWQLARHPYPPYLLVRRKAEFVAAIAEFKAGRRVGPGRERGVDAGVVVGPPLPPAHFTGREPQVRAIGDRLTSFNRRAAVVGMGGVGKTSLALSVAKDRRANFPGGVFWGELADESDSVSELLRAWMRSFGRNVAGLSAEEQLAMFADALDKRCTESGGPLLLIDNASERSAEDLVRLLSYVPSKASVLVTTRDATVGAAIGAAQFKIEPLSRPSSRNVLESVSGSGLVRSEAEAVDALLALLGDLPLAVELVARQIAIRHGNPNFTISALLGQLEAFNSQLLSFPGHRGIAMSFALSYENLDEKERRLFRALGVFASRALFAADVAVVDALSPEQADATLDRFVIVSLLNWGDGSGQYRMHPLLHQYAEHLFEGSPTSEREEICERFYLHYAGVATKAFTTDQANLSSIDRIYSNLTKAMHLASAAGAHKVVCETLLGLCARMDYFTLRNLERESIPLLETAISAAKKLGDLEHEGAFESHIGTACTRLGELAAAKNHYERAIAIARKSGNDFDLSCSLQNLGTALISEASDFRCAEKVLREALVVAERAQNSDALIGCFSSLAYLHRDTGNLEEAARLYGAALRVSRLVGKRLSEGNTLSNLGLVMELTGRAEEGEKMVKEALAIALEIGDLRGEGNRTGHLGNMLLARARRMPVGPERQSVRESAVAHIEKALAIAQETGDVEKATTWLMNLGLALVDAGKFEEGAGQLEHILTVARQGGFMRIEAQALMNLGYASVALGRLKAALAHYVSARTLLRKMGSPVAAQAEEYITRIQAVLSRAP